MYVCMYVCVERVCRPCRLLECRTFRSRRMVVAVVIGGMVRGGVCVAEMGIEATQGGGRFNPPDFKRCET